MVKPLSYRQRLTLWVSSAIASLLVVGYAGRQFLFACMASSALIGLPAYAGVQRHYSVLSAAWLLVALAAVAAFIISIVRLSRGRST